MKKSKLLMAGVVSAFVLGATSAHAVTLTLRECLDQAVDHSPGLASGRAIIAAWKADMVKKRGNALPYFSGLLQGWVLNGSPATQWQPTGLSEPGFGTIPGKNVHWVPVGLEQIGVTYPLVSEGSIMGLNDPPGVASARANMTEQQAENIITMERIVLEVMNDYTYITSYREQLETQRQAVKRAQEQLAIVTDQQRQRLKLPQDVAIAQAQLDAAEQGMHALTDNIHTFVSDISMLIGHGSDADFELSGKAPPTPTLPPLPQFLDQVMPGHPALRVQQGKVEIERQQLRADIGNFWPSATLTTQFTGAQDLEIFNGRNQNPRPTSFESYLSVSLPLYDFGQRRAAIDESTENVLAQKDLIGDIDRQTRNAIATAYNQIAQYSQTVASSMSEYVKSEKTAELARAQADQGIGEELTWVQDDLSALQSKATLQTAQLNERLQYASLQNLAGGTWHWQP